MDTPQKNKMKEELEASLHNDPESAELLEIWNMIPAEPALSVAEKKADREKVRQALGQSAPLRKISLWQSGLIAAVSVAAALLLFMLLSRPEPAQTLVADTIGGKAFTLPDGSTVYLSFGSTLQLKNGMKGDRIVILNGEALFEVVKSGQTFVVETSNAVVTVLGTTFKVTNGAVVDSDSSDYTKVMLAEGRVQVEFPAVNLQEELKPGEESALIGKTHTRRSIQNNWLDNWKMGRLHFENETLTYIFSEIQRQYDVELEIDPKVDLNERLSYYRKRPASPDSVLNEIAAIKNLQISFKNDTFAVTR